MRGALREAIGALVLGLVIGTLGCPPNEAIVCGSKSENAGPSCSADYDLCAGGTDRIECKPAGSGVTCACIESGTTKKTFQSNDACNVSVDTLKMRAMDNCGWKLDDSSK